MEMVSFGPLPAEFLVWQPSPKAWALTVACKATFPLRPGEAMLSAEQTPILEQDNYWDDNVARSVCAPCDLVPFKPSADVVLVGAVFAPNRTPVRSVTACLTLGEIVKSIEVFCDRAMMLDDSIQEGSGFIRMPLLYERAAGGGGTSNPVGMRADARDAYGRIILPNLQKPGTRPSSAAFPEPIGFGPIAPHWPQRLEKLGARAQSWSPYAFRGEPLPPGMDPSYFNVAPPDQQLAALREADWMFLENLHPEYPQLRINLPELRPAVFAQMAERPPQRLAMHMDTIWIDTDQQIFTVTWRGRLALSHRAECVRAVTSMEVGKQAITWAELESNLLGPRPSTLAVRAPMATLPHGETEASKPLPPPYAAEALLSSQGGESTAFFSTVPTSGAGPAKEDAPAYGLPFAPSAPRVAPRTRLDAFQSADSRGRDFPFVPFASPAVEGPPRESLDALPFAPKPSAPPPPKSTPESSPWASGAAIAAPAPFSSPGVLRPPMGSPVGPPVEPPLHLESSPMSAPPGPVFSGSVGAMAASNAAAQPWATTPSPSAAPALALVQPIGRTAYRTEPPDVNQLLWYHPQSVARFRRSPEWKIILQALERKPRDKELDDPATADDPMEMEERREVFEILTHGTPKSHDAVQQTYLAAIRDDGKFVPPLVLVAGELSFFFDELETLKATVTTVSPLATPNDESLRAALENAKEFLKTPGLSSAPAVSDGLTTRIKEAFGQGRRSVPAGYVDTHTERVLLEQRYYQKRAVLGEKYLRALLPLPGSSAPLPTYLPEAVSSRLPMYQRFRARLIVEVHQQEDQYESNPLALRVLALSRMTPPPRR